MICKKAPHQQTNQYKTKVKSFLRSRKLRNNKKKWLTISRLDIQMLATTEYKPKFSKSWLKSQPCQSKLKDDNLELVRSSWPKTDHKERINILELRRTENYHRICYSSWISYEIYKMKSNEIFCFYVFN